MKASMPAPSASRQMNRRSTNPGEALPSFARHGPVLLAGLEHVVGDRAQSAGDLAAQLRTGLGAAGIRVLPFVTSGSSPGR